MTEEIEPGRTAAEDEIGSPWTDLRAYAALPRLTGLMLSPDGARLVATVSAPDQEQTAYRSSLWSIDPSGASRARRLTRSVEGESSAVFLADGDLLFTSKRTTPAAGPEPVADTESAVWCLPAAGGEAYVVARRDGGWGGLLAARHAPVVVLDTPTHVGVDDEEADQAKRKDRRTRKISAILHDGYPVRHWDHDLGPEASRLCVVDLDTARTGGPDREPEAENRGQEGGDLVLSPEDLTTLSGDVGRALGEGRALSDDGRRLVVEWRTARPRGITTVGLESYDLHTGERTTVAADLLDDIAHPVLSSDATMLVAVQERASTAETAPDSTLVLFAADGTRRDLAEDWDAWPTPVAFSPDAGTVYVLVDEDGQGPLYAVDVTTGSRRRLTPAQGAGFGTFTSPVLSPDGSTLYAIRSSYADAGTVVAVATDGSAITELRAMAYPELPGTVHDVDTTTDDGTRVRGWLLLPAGTSTDQPAPLALWVHGGPLGSWNAWSWRWCPWLMVAQGYAVLLPDPALSTGYGQDFVQRGWGRWGAEPYTDVMALTDDVLGRPEIDPNDPIAMGGSFGGYLANWIAGHTDRFAGIVTHASLWNLEAFGPTTDASWYWSKELSPAMQHAYSPHRFADDISTPMLVIHGDQDYRVPISQGLALWWELCARHDDDPSTLPHRFLYFPDENHWVLTPQHAIVWYETVLGFCLSVRSDGNFVRPGSL